jgi:hypothetical protein
MLAEPEPPEPKLPLKLGLELVALTALTVLLVL